jgi:large conductance mechanosensitive channel
MSIIKEFRTFAMKGNLIDMAVAFVMGGAFAKLVTSFIDGIVMPVVGKITTGMDFKAMKYIIAEAQTDANGKTIVQEVAIKYGEFITVFIDFVLVAFVMFLIVKAMNKAKEKLEEAPKPAAAPEPTKEEKLLTEIRDLLKK